MNYLQLKKRAFMSILNRTKELIIRTVSGVPPISLEDCVDSDSLIDWKLYGNSVQDGTPTPEAPAEVISVGDYDSETGKYKIPVTARGKNLFDKSSDKINGFATKTLDNDGNIVIDGGSGTGNYISANFVIPNWECLIGKTLTISGSWIVSDLNKGAIRIQYNRNGSAVGTVFGILNNSGEVKTTPEITAPSQDGDVLCVYLYANTNGTMSQNATVTYTNIQLETGTTATDYEPYHAPIQTNIYLDEPLRSQHQQTESKWYYDEINFKTNILIRNLSEKTFVGAANENWKYSKETDEKIYFYMTGLLNNCSFGKDSVMCDRFVANYVYATNITSIAEGISVATSTNRCYLSIFKSRLTDAGLTVDLDGFKTWLSQNPVTITYILKEPTEESIQLPKLPTIKGTTIYEIGTSLNASNMEATYKSK